MDKPLTLGCRCLDRSASPARLVTFAGWLGLWAYVLLEDGAACRVLLRDLEPLA